MKRFKWLERNKEHTIECFRFGDGNIQLTISVKNSAELKRVFAIIQAKLNSGTEERRRFFPTRDGEQFSLFPPEEIGSIRNLPVLLRRNRGVRMTHPDSSSGDRRGTGDGPLRQKIS